MHKGKLTNINPQELQLSHDIRVKRKKEQAVVEKDKELHEMEKEFEAEKARREKQIVQLEKEKLEHDLQHKSQEMANLMKKLCS